MNYMINFIHLRPAFESKYHSEFGHYLYHVSKQVLVHPSLDVWYFIGRSPSAIELKILQNQNGKPRVYVVRSDYMEEYDLNLERTIGDTIILWSTEPQDSWIVIWKDYWIPPYHSGISAPEPSEPKHATPFVEGLDG